jgi:type IV pilus assembly protein PilX
MAHASHRKKNERGNVLLVSLLLLLVMSLMGTGLYCAMSKESRMVDSGSVGTETFYAAETCLEDALGWLENEVKTEAPDSQSKTANLHDDRDLAAGGEDWEKDRFKRYCYDYTIERLSSSTSATAGGYKIPEDQWYKPEGSTGAAATPSAKNNYRITCTGYYDDTEKCNSKKIKTVLEWIVYR